MSYQASDLLLRVKNYVIVLDYQYLMRYDSQNKIRLMFFDLTHSLSQRWSHLGILDQGVQHFYRGYVGLVLIPSRSYSVQWRWFISRRLLCYKFTPRDGSSRNFIVVHKGDSQDGSLICLEGVHRLPCIAYLS